MTPAETYAQKREEAIELIRAHAPARLQESLIELLRPAIALSATRAEDDEIPIGASKFGGAPDVPLHFLWPTWNEKPLGFLAQINLEEVAPFDVENLLPENGLLSFFYDLKEQPWGDPSEEGTWRVFYFEGQNLFRDSSIVAKKDAVKIAKISFECRWTSMTDYLCLPNLNDKLTEEETSLFWEYFEKVFGDSASHQLLGNPKVEQSEPRIEADFHANGLLMHGDEMNNWQAHVEEISNWQLLFQIDTDKELDFMWCDCGLLYFLIRREDLVTRSWDKTWLILQSG